MRSFIAAFLLLGLVGFAIGEDKKLNRRSRWISGTLSI
jgi:hypothetical protein